MDYKERQKPEVFKPLIDAALLRIAHVAGADENAVDARLAEVEPVGDSWQYLSMQATPTIRDILVTDALKKALEYSWDLAMLEGTLDEDPNALDYVELEYYPEEALDCLDQELYIGGSDADVIALWEREDRTSICHAHMEGFWILGEDAIDWIEKIADNA